VYPDILQERLRVSPGFFRTGLEGMDSRLWPFKPDGEREKNMNNVLEESSREIKESKRREFTKKHCPCSAIQQRTVDEVLQNSHGRQRESSRR
jgi:hypothetical protein